VASFEDRVGAGMGHSGRRRRWRTQRARRAWPPDHLLFTALCFGWGRRRPREAKEVERSHHHDPSALRARVEGHGCRE